MCVCRCVGSTDNKPSVYNEQLNTHTLICVCTIFVCSITQRSGCACLTNINLHVNTEQHG